MDAADTCPSCGELRDAGALACRFCGERFDLEDLSGEDEYISTEGVPLDRLGTWSEVKHSIVDEYAHAYTTILKKQPFVKKLLYIDGFAGPGVALDRDTEDFVLGSPSRI